MPDAVSERFATTAPCSLTSNAGTTSPPRRAAAGF